MFYWLFDVAVSFVGVILPLVLIPWRPSQKRHLGLIVLVAMYFLALWTVVGIPSVPYFYWRPNVSLVPFGEIHAPGMMTQTVLNVILFLPMGYLVPLCWPEDRKLWRITGFAMNISLFIELLQMFAGRATDIDDFLTNTAGAILGYLIFKLTMPRKFCHHRAGVGSLYLLMNLTLLYRILLGQTVYNFAWKLFMV